MWLATTSCREKGFKRTCGNIGRDLMASKIVERFQRLEKRIEELEETVEILSDPGTMKDIREALDDLKAGRVRVYEDIDVYMTELGSSS